MVIAEVKVSPASNDLKNGKESGVPDDTAQENSEEREMWASKWEFLLSCIGLSVGIGNVWRFPYLAYANGGGSFLLAYLICQILIGKPLYFVEIALGQFSGLSAVRVWRCFPIAKGIGVAMIVMSVMVAIYYNVIMCYTLYYMGQSFRSVVPWKECFSWWGADELCYVRQSNRSQCKDVKRELAKKYSVLQNATKSLNDSDVINITMADGSVSVPLHEYQKAYNTCVSGNMTASEQFWEKYVLQLTTGINEIGTVKWDLALTLFACWVIVFLGLMKGIKTSGKVVYFTATFPFVIMIILVIYGCTLNGASAGLKYFFIPKWEKLLEIEVWRAAAEQLFFSLSLGWGALIMYGSYNKFDNPLYSDFVIICTLDFLTSLIAGTVIFAVLGHLATEMDLDISDVAKKGHGLAFVAYPEALAKLPVPQLWALLFFFMLFLLAIDSQFAYMENIFTTLFDEYPHLRKKKISITLVICMALFLLGLPCVTQGGQYIFNLMDKYAAGYTVLFVITIETIVIMWGYGGDRLALDIKFMLGFMPSIYWRVCWKFVSPALLVFVLVYSFSQHKIIDYDGVPYPMWGEAVGWLLILVSLIQIPIWAAIELYKHRKNPSAVFHPHHDWGPLDPENRRRYQQFIESGENNENDGGVVNLGMDKVTEPNA